MKPCTSLFTLIVCAAPNVAQQDPPPRPVDRAAAEKPAGAKAPFVFEAGDIELTELVERCAAYLQRNILVADIELATVHAGGGRARPRRGQVPVEAPAASGPTVTLHLPVVTDRDGCEELLSGILWSNGLALVPVDEAKGVYEVLSMNGPRAREIAMRAVPRTPEQVLARPALRQVVTVVCHLQHTNAMIANNALRPFFAQSAGSGPGNLVLGNIGNDGALVLGGPQHLVATALHVLQVADVPTPAGIGAQLGDRVETLAKQNEALRERVAALEKKMQQQGR